LRIGEAAQNGIDAQPSSRAVPVISLPDVVVPGFGVTLLAGIVPFVCVLFVVRPLSLDSWLISFNEYLCRKEVIIQRMKSPSLTWHPATSQFRSRIGTIGSL